jgi:hypothetical protein
MMYHESEVFRSTCGRAVCRICSRLTQGHSASGFFTVGKIVFSGSRHKLRKRIDIFVGVSFFFILKVTRLT